MEKIENNGENMSFILLKGNYSRYYFVTYFFEIYVQLLNEIAMIISV